MYNIYHVTWSFEMLFDMLGYIRFRMHNICHVTRSFGMHKMIIEKNILQF